MLEKTEGAIKIVQSRDTGNIVHKRYRTKTYMSIRNPPKTGVESRCPRRASGVLLHHYTYE
jgi:hypothetical protein